MSAETVVVEPELDVLFVDDEPNVLSAMRRMMHSERYRWHMHFAPSGEEALAMLRARHFDVVVTDMQMPGMDGSELLSRVRDWSPSTVRIILSGHADRAAALKAAAVAHQFIHKPADPETLKEAVARAGRLCTRIQRAQLRSALGGVDSLPSPPQTVRRLNDALADPECDAGTVAAIVESDMAITSKVLQLVNSAFFSLPREVTSIQQAVAYLGLDNLQALVGSVEVFRVLQGASTAELSRGLQSHGLQVWRLADRILDGRENSHQIFLGTLLHDIGLLSIASLFPQMWQELVSIPRDEWTLEREIELVGASHADIGAYILTLWGFPLRAADIVASHHGPLDAVRDGRINSVQAVQLAEMLVSEAAGHLGPRPDLGPEEVQRLGLSELIEGWRGFRDQMAEAA